MSGPTAALALSAALLIQVSPRHRLPGPPRPRRPAGRAVRRRAVLCGLLGGLGAVLAALLPMTVSLAIAVLATTVGLRSRGRARHRERIREAGALETALDILAGELRVGAHPVPAFEAAAGETGHPGVAAALRAVAARARLGADVGAGLISVAGSSPLPGHWMRLAAYWQLGAQHGLAISTLMQAAQRDIAERRRFAAQVDAGMAGARASAAILAVLPVLGLLLGQLVGAAPLRFLLGRGSALLLFGVVLVCAGLHWSDRITGRFR